MRVATISDQDDFDGWRAAARSFASCAVPADQIVWRVGQDYGDLLSAAADALPAAGGTAALSVPRPFLDMARKAICHSDPQRFALLYALLIRLQGQPGLL